MMSLFSFLILVIYIFSPFFLDRLARGLSILLIYLKSQLLALLIFSTVFDFLVYALYYSLLLFFGGEDVNLFFF